MRHLLPVLLGTLAMPAALSAADFPPPAQLPSRPEFPDPLTTLDGQKVTTVRHWEAVRKPELKELFQHYMYGRYPTVKASVSGKVLFEDAAAFGGKATLREVAVTMAEGAPPVYVLIAVPNQKGKPAPAFVGLNFTGNHAVTTDERVRVPTGWVRSGKGKGPARGSSDSWPLEQIVGRGYAVATAFYGEIIPDDPKAAGGLSPILMPKLGDRGPDDTAAIMGWAWALHRITDYLTTVPGIDPKKVAVVGHSRLGKTALVAAAFDDRLAACYPSQGGTGGPAPSRSTNPKSEPVKRINEAFPHWFAKNFAAFGADPSKLPFDQHALVALCAPRPVMFTNATEDQWANPPGQFDVLKAATPVYKLYGVEGLTAANFPPENTLIDSRLGYWVRPGKHAMGPDDWGAYLTFADKWLK